MHTIASKQEASKQQQNKEFKLMKKTSKELLWRFVDSYLVNGLRDLIQICNVASRVEANCTVNLVPFG